MVLSEDDSSLTACNGDGEGRKGILEKPMMMIQSNLSKATAQGKHHKNVVFVDRWSLKTDSFSACFNKKPFPRKTKNVVIVDRWLLKQV